MMKKVKRYRVILLRKNNQSPKKKKRLRTRKKRPNLRIYDLIEK
jgi:hypothetical protein